MKACILLILVLIAMPVLSSEPSWLITVPKSESLPMNIYNVGLLYFDFGVTRDLELGIHGIKYSLDRFAFGFSLFPMGSPYIVFSPIKGQTEVHIGMKVAPYILFAGIEADISNNLRFMAEMNNGLSAGVRILPSKNWSIDLFLAFISFQTYRYKYERLEVHEFYAIPGISFAYSGRF